MVLIVRGDITGTFVMDFIIKYKKTLTTIAFISAATAFAFILYLRDKGTIENVANWQIGLFVLPWIIFTLSFLPLTYLSWFGTNKFGAATFLFKIFYWALVVGFIVIFAGIYRTFVF